MLHSFWVLMPKNSHITKRQVRFSLLISAFRGAGRCILLHLDGPGCTVAVPVVSSLHIKLS